MTSSITWVGHDPAARDQMLRILSFSREKESRDEPSRMNIGIALKIINLLLKHMSFSEHCKNERVVESLHVPWDSFTLSHLRTSGQAIHRCLIHQARGLSGPWISINNYTP